VCNTFNFTAGVRLLVAGGSDIITCFVFQYPTMSLIGDCFALPFGAGYALRLVLSCRENFSSLCILSKCLAAVFGKVSQNH
jgi:hypothetical protein